MQKHFFLLFVQEKEKYSQKWLFENFGYATYCFNQFKLNKMAHFIVCSRATFEKSHDFDAFYLFIYLFLFLRIPIYGYQQQLELPRFHLMFLNKLRDIDEYTSVMRSRLILK